MQILGLDIGGANIKAVILSCNGYRCKVNSIYREYLPLWIMGKDALYNKLLELRNAIGDEQYYVSVCMTAELSDIYRVKRDGVHHIVDTVVKVFGNANDIGFVTIHKNLVDPKKARERYLEVAAANWAASAWLLEKFCGRWGIDNSLFIDIGSTTTTLIPIINCNTCVRGFTDPEKLVYGELVYTGVLRSNIATIIDRVPYKGLFARVSSERFALSGDVHLILGYIDSSEYNTETADGRGKSIGEAIDRLSRVPCGDSEILNFYEVREIARYVYEAQVFKVFEAVIQLKSLIASMNIDPDNLKVVVAGIGKHMAMEAARRAGLRIFIDIDDLIGKKISPVLPSYGAALMMYSKVVGVEESSS